MTLYDMTFARSRGLDGIMDSVEGESGYRLSPV